MTDPYVEIAGQRPNEVGVGGALIALVEPDPGFEHAYNRWYEDDHFYAGAMNGPWTFAGKRWVATKDLQLLRYPTNGALVDPIRAGCYLTAHLFTAGHVEESMRWYRAVMSDNLYHQGRGFDQRRHVFTSYHRLAFSSLRDDERPLAPQHTLDHPFNGVVLEVLQAVDDEHADDLVEWLRTDFVPRELSGSDAAVALAFRPVGAEVGSVPGLDGIPTPERLVTMLWMLESDPRAHWSHWADHGALVEDAGLGRVLLGAPFVPTVPGTDRYVSELR